VGWENSGGSRHECHLSDIRPGPSQADELRNAPLSSRTVQPQGRSEGSAQHS